MSVYTTIGDTITRVGATLGEARGTTSELLRATYAERAIQDLSSAIHGLEPFTDFAQLRPIATEVKSNLGVAVDALHKSLEPVVVQTTSAAATDAAATAGAAQLATATTVTKVLGPSDDLIAGVLAITERSNSDLRGMLVELRNIGTDVMAHRAALVEEHEAALAFRQTYAPRVSEEFARLGEAAEKDPDFINLAGAVNDNKAKMDALERALEAQMTDVAEWQTMTQQLFG